MSPRKRPSAKVKAINRKDVPCPECNGTGVCVRCGGTGRETCTRCNGTGQVEDNQTCPVCLGAGSLPCVSCNGSGRCFRCNGAGTIPDGTYLQRELKDETSLDLVQEIKKRCRPPLATPDQQWIFIPSFTQDLLAVDFAPLPLTQQPEGLFTANWNNGTSASDIQRFSGSETRTDTYSWSVSKSIQTGVSTQFKVGLPFISGGVTVSINLNLSSTETQGQSISKGWQWDTTITIPPKKHVTASAILQKGTYDATFTARMKIKGWVTGMCINCPHDVQHTGEDSYMAFLGLLFSETPHPAVKVVDADEIIVETVGVFHSVLGVAVTVDTKEEPATKA